ncbi:MAG TPA: Ig-like domain repeat protein [Acidobacteriaceae bacterium]|nr:Ig-like domain repeat protein [Acidobacteriaceae bacterium]
MPREDRAHHYGLPGSPARQRTRLRFSLLLLVLLAFAGFSSDTFAQSLSPGGPVDFGGVNLGTTSSVTTLTFFVPAGSPPVTVGPIIALTLGVSGKDFAASTSTCIGTLPASTACTITVTFTPAVLGLRTGELLVEDGSGNVTNRVPLRGAGLGPQMVVSPATAVAITSLTGISPATINPSSTVLDGAGNLYIDDALNGRILESTTSGSATLLGAVPASTTSAPFSSIAIAGDGTLYISSPNTGAVYKIPVSGSPTAISTPGVTLLQPAGLALDGFGYLYVADAGANKIIRIDTENGNAAAAITLTGLSTPLSSPEGLTIDDSDNLYVADANNNRIVEISLHSYAATVLPLSGLTLSAPAAVAANAAGGLTVADTGNKRLVELPVTGAPYAITLLGATLTTPAGVMLLPTGDLLVSDTVAGLVQVTRSASSLTFATPTLVGSVDTADGDLALNVENTGTYLLNVAGNDFPSISNNAFFADTTGTCPNTTNGTNGTQVLVGEACTLEIGFKPTIAGINTGTLNVSASGNGNVTANVNLTGTGYHVLDHFTVVIAPSTVTPGQATTLTITAINNDGTIDTTYTGTINLSCTDPACKLPFASYTFTAANNGVLTVSSTAANALNFNTLGTWTVTVTDTTFTPGQTYTGTSNPVTVITTPAVSLTSSVNPVNLGANTTLTATVSSAYGTPTGTVTFMDGGTVLGTGTLNSSGVATLTVSFSTAGTHPLTVSYPGAGFFQAANSAVLNQVVQTFGTTLGLTSSVNPVIINANTVLTATASSTSGTPTGTITFLDGTTVLGTAPLNASGVATLTVSFSTTGTHPITATYPATGPYLAATSSVLNETVQTLTTTVGLTSSVNPVIVNANTVLSATVSSTSGTPTGTITFLDGTTVLGTAPLNASGVATLTVSFSTSGTHPITATYPATSPYQAATSSVLNETVQTLTTTVGLTSSVNPVNVNSNTVLTATASSTTGTPTGAITFLDGTTVLGTAPLNASGVATLTASFAAPGTHPLTASYAGTSPYGAATSAVVNENVQNFSTTAALTSSVNPVLISSSTALTATISSSAGTPTGTVTFYDGTKAIGTATLNTSGAATLNVTFSTNGQHILTASYAGNGLYQPITTTPLTQVVEDFSLALATGSQNSATIILGASTQYNLVVSPIGANSLAAPVALSVTGLPSGGSGTFNPSSVAGGAGITPVVLTVTAPPLTGSLRRPVNPASPSLRHEAPAFVAFLLLPTGFLLRRRRTVIRLLLIFVGLAAVSTGLSGCLQDQATGYYGNDPQTYTVTVTGTAGTLTHTVQVTLTVD